MQTELTVSAIEQSETGLVEIEAVLSDFIDIKHGFAFKGHSIHDEPTGDVLLTPGNFEIGGGFKSAKFKYYDGEVPEEYVLKPGDLLLTMTDLSKQSDTLGLPALIPERSDGRRYLHNQRLGKVSIRDAEKLDERYLYYVFCSPEYRQEVLASATGTTVKHTSPDRIRRFRILVPPLSEQRRIAHILGTLDDKIELNRRMNETLEEMARAIFKDWFVDFGPVRAKMEGRDAYLPSEVWRLFPDRLVESELGEVPEGWGVKALDEFANVVYGAAFASKRFNDYGRGVPLIRIRDLSTNNPSVFTDEVHPKGQLIKPGDIVVGMDGEFRAYYWLGESAWLNQRVCHFEPLVGVPKVFLRESIAEPLALLERSKVGTTVIHLGKRDIDNFEILVPSPSVLESFAQATEQLLHRIKTNAAESRSLASKRDSLLPVLVSGILQTSTVERRL